jgi:hypothetical protein
MFNHYQEAAPAQSLTAGTEALATGGLSPASLPIPPAPEGVVIRGRFNATGGATGGGWSVKCRKGNPPTTASTQVGATQTVTVAATTTVDVPFSFVDTSPSPQPTQYSLTLTAAGSNGTLNDVGLEVMVPDVYGEDV